MSNCAILTIDRTLPDAIIPGLSGRGNDSNEGMFCIPQSSSITGASPADCLMSYSRHSLVGVLPLCRDVVGVFYYPRWLGSISKEEFQRCFDKWKKNEEISALNTNLQDIHITFIVSFSDGQYDLDIFVFGNFVY